MQIARDQASVALFAEQEGIILTSRDGSFSLPIYGHRTMATMRAPGAPPKEIKPALIVELEDPTDESEIRQLIGMVAGAKGERTYPPEAQGQDLEHYRSTVAASA